MTSPIFLNKAYLISLSLFYFDGGMQVADFVHDTKYFATSANYWPSIHHMYRPQETSRKPSRLARSQISDHALLTQRHDSQHMDTNLLPLMAWLS